MRIAGDGSRLHMTYRTVGVVKHVIDGLLDDDVALHEQEAVRQQLKEFLNRKRVLEAAEIRLHRKSGLSLWILLELLVEVDDLTSRVVDHRHAIHFLDEWSAV